MKAKTDSLKRINKISMLLDMLTKKERRIRKLLISESVD